MKYISSIIIFFVAYFFLAEIFEFGETTSVILSLIGAALFYNSRQEKKNISSNKVTDSITSTDDNIAVKKESDEEDEYESVSIFGAKPRKGTEAHRVQQEVEKKKNLAKEKKINELISELYFDNITYYPSWIKHEDRSYVPAIITSATELKEKGEKNDRDKKIIKITLNEKKYQFAFKENSFSTPDGEYHTHGLLELFDGDKKVLGLDVSLEHGDYDSTWSPYGIEAFIDGEWIEDFRSLKKQKIKDDKERALKKAEDPEKTEEMKKNFGIE